MIILISLRAVNKVVLIYGSHGYSPGPNVKNNPPLFLEPLSEVVKRLCCIWLSTWQPDSLDQSDAMTFWPWNQGLTLLSQSFFPVYKVMYIIGPALELHY